MKAAYSHILSDMNDLPPLENTLGFESAYEHYVALCAWMKGLSGFLSVGYENPNIRKLRIATDYIAAHFRTRINMATVSNQVSMNYSQFSSLFKQYTGSGFTGYLRATRIAESKRLLSNPSMSLHEVGKESGFVNEKHFMRSFKQETGISPSDYRRSLQR
jgi:two-component system response regulator YesN